MNLFYTKRILSDRQPAQLVLEGQEATHASRVLRIREGEAMMATDGNGSLYRGSVLSSSGDQVICRIEEQTYHPQAAPSISIAMGLIKKRDRIEFAVEKAVEMGVTDLLIWQGDRSEKKNIRMARLQAAALHGMKQSLRVWLPEIRFFNHLGEVLDSSPSSSSPLFADETVGADFQPKEWLNRRQAEELLFIVGPEGGFSEDERQILEKAGAEGFSLGKYRLRTETAVITIASLFL